MINRVKGKKEFEVEKKFKSAKELLEETKVKHESKMNTLQKSLEKAKQDLINIDKVTIDDLIEMR